MMYRQIRYNFNVNKKTRLGRKSISSLKLGIVGMANVGKSATFNLLSDLEVPSENIPFCTIDPNQAVVSIKDPRFEHLCNLYQPNKQTPGLINIIDVAGLIKGAHEGYGLGNEFLSHIGSTDAIYQVVRAFHDPNIRHTEGEMDASRDIHIINQELIQKDIQMNVKKVNEAYKKYKKSQGNEQFEKVYNTLLKVDDVLKNQKRRIVTEQWSDEEIQVLNLHQYLTSKYMCYLVNISIDDYLAYVDDKASFKASQQIEQTIQQLGGGNVLYYSVDFEQYLKLDQDFYDEYHMHSQLNNIIAAGYDLLDLCYFFTTGKDEVKCWTIRKETRAQDAAGVIHTDFVKGFIAAEVMSFQEFKEMGDEAMDKLAKKSRKEGKEYIVQDGDIINFQIKIKR